MEIKITRKKIKNIIIKVNEKGEVLVSAPYKVPNSYIENLLQEKKEWIREKIEQVKNKQEKISTFEEGDEFIYLGKKYTIKIKISSVEYCELTEEHFILNIKINNFENRKKIISKWLTDNFCTLVKNRTIELGKRIGYLPSIIKFRDMKTRWGSCNTLTRSITFNLQLYKKPLEVIDYVILHELAHIPYPHHQKEFWNFVEKYMPDWKKRRDLLKTSS